jgi:2'-5' RNA ligase
MINNFQKIEYAKDTANWEKWKFEYQYGAFYIFLPNGLIEPIDELRRKFDPKSADYCRAHISLSEPLSGPLTDEQLLELKEALSRIKPFEIKYGPLRSFTPYPGVCYTITPEKEFFELRQAIHSTSIFAENPLTRKDRAPHMTIAEFITVQRTEELLKELQGKVPEGTFQCGSIEYAVPNDEFYFERVLTIPIGSK